MLLDQRQLPEREHWLAIETVDEVVAAIAKRQVCGAAAVGIAAAFGVVLAAAARAEAGEDGWAALLEADMQRLAAAGDSASFLQWALGRMRERLARLRPPEGVAALLDEAQAILRSDREASLTMAQAGAELIRRHGQGAQRLLTHGNDGALAGGGFGSALGVVRAAHLEGLLERVYVDETRPWLQGARLSAWELAEERLPVSLAVDAAAGQLMKSENISWVVVGAERITASGDLVATVGTYALAVLAMHHGVRFMVVAPSARIDLTIESGEDVLPEQGDAALRGELGGVRLAKGAEVFDPLFDVTPADLIDVIVTERGVVERPDSEKLAALVSRKRLH